MLQMCDGAVDLEQKLFSHFPREAVTDEDALNDQIFTVRRHGVRGNKPAALAQQIGDLIEREWGRGGVLQLPAKARDATGSVINDFKRSQRCDFDREFSSDGGALRLNITVTLLAEAQEIVVLTDDF